MFSIWNIIALNRKFAFKISSILLFLFYRQNLTAYILHLEICAKMCSANLESNFRGGSDISIICRYWFLVDIFMSSFSLWRQLIFLDDDVNIPNSTDRESTLNITLCSVEQEEMHYGLRSSIPNATKLTFILFRQKKLGYTQMIQTVRSFKISRGNTYPSTPIISKIKTK